MATKLFYPRENVYDIQYLELNNGWIPANETWTYASADDPTFTFTIAGVDLTTKYSPGMRIKLTQTTEKYFIITKVAFSTDTTITIYGGTDYDLANAAITSPYYSMVKAPFGFPLNPAKWTLQMTDTSNRSQVTPVQNTWYNLGSLSLDIHIGIWNVCYKVTALLDGTGASMHRDVFTTLSTANNSESDSSWSQGWDFYLGTSTQVQSWVPFYVEGIIERTSKATYYLNERTIRASMNYVQIQGASGAPTVIKAVCAYL